MGSSLAPFSYPKRRGLNVALGPTHMSDLLCRRHREVTERRRPVEEDAAELQVEVRATQRAAAPPCSGGGGGGAGASICFDGHM